AREIASHLLPLRDRTATAENAQVIQEEAAVEVIELMLQAACEQVRRFHFEQISLQVQPAHARDGWPFHVTEDLRDREAAFLGLVAPFRVQQLRIHEGVACPIHVADEQALLASDLRRRQADPLRGMHRLEHVVGEPANLVGDSFDRDRLLAQDRRAEYVNLQHAHDVASVDGVMTRATRPRSTISRESPLLIVSRSSSVATACPSFMDFFTSTMSPTIPPAVTIASPRFSSSSRVSCCLRCFC